MHNRLRVARLGNSESHLGRRPHTLTCVMLQGLANYVYMAVQFAVLAMCIYALVHAAMQRPDAYTAIEKLTKPVWLLILAGSIALTLLLPVMGMAIAACAAGVYLVDVRPKLLEIQGKSR